MKKNIYFIISMFFTSNLFSSDCCFSVISTNSILTTANAVLKYKVGTFAHESLTINFNNSNNIDQRCANISGLAWTAYGLSVISPEACCCLASTLLLAHNSQKAAKKLFNPHDLTAPYNRPTKSSPMK